MVCILCISTAGVLFTPTQTLDDKIAPLIGVSALSGLYIFVTMTVRMGMVSMRSQQLKQILRVHIAVVVIATVTMIIRFCFFDPKMSSLYFSLYLIFAFGNFFHLLAVLI